MIYNIFDDKNNIKPDVKKLLHFGFVYNRGCYYYETPIVDGQFLFVGTFYENGIFETKIYDTSNNDEYVLHLVPSASGAFVGRVRLEYDGIISELLEKCFYHCAYDSLIINKLIDYIEECYNDEIEFPWNDENSVVRRKDNKKWYAVFMKVSARKLGLDKDKIIDVMNLKLEPREIENLIDFKNYFPAYHMNKKHWITIVPDANIDIGYLKSLIDKSNGLASK